jgi:hypothetical protein
MRWDVVEVVGAVQAGAMTTSTGSPPARILGREAQRADIERHRAAPRAQQHRRPAHARRDQR